MQVTYKSQNQTTIKTQVKPPSTRTLYPDFELTGVWLTRAPRNFGELILF